MPTLFNEDKAPRLTSPGMCRKNVARLFARLALLTLAVFHCGCAVPTASSRSGPAQPTAAPAPSPDSGAQSAERAGAHVEEVSVTDSFVEGDELTHEGYTVRRREKKVRSEFPPESQEPAPWDAVSYAVLERDGKVVASFDGGIHNGGLNSTSFGLFPFLGGGAKQFIISQDAPRGGRQWVVSLSPRLRVVYDGAAFGTGREADDMGVGDLDGDGVYEITVPDCGLYGFKGWVLAPMQTPLPTVIFKYDARAGKYLPANELFQADLLKEVAERAARVAGPEDRTQHLADVLAVVAGYVFAGREREAWAFYEASYALPDKPEVRREIEEALRARPVYRFMYAQRAAR